MVGRYAEELGLEEYGDCATYEKTDYISLKRIKTSHATKEEE